MKKHTIVILLILNALVAFSQSDTLLLRIQVELMQENYENALNLSEKSTESKFLMAKAQALSGLYRYDDAEKIIQSLLKTAPNQLNALALLAKIYTANGEKNEALKTYEKILSLDSLHVTALNVLAANSPPKKAIEYYNRLYRHYPTNSLYPTRIGNSYIALDEQEIGIRYFLEALKINPKNINAIVPLANAYFKTDKPDSTIFYINYGLDFAPENTQLLRRKAMYLYAAREFKESVRFFEKCIQFGDSVILVYKYAGIAAYKCNGYYYFEKAFNFFEKAFQLDPNDSEICYYRGMSAANWYNYKLAVEMLERAKFLIQPDANLEFEIEVGLATTHRKYVQPEKALESFKNTLKYKGSERYMYDISSIYHGLKKFDESILWLEKYKEVVKADTTEYGKKAMESIDNQIIRLKEEKHMHKD